MLGDRLHHGRDPQPAQQCCSALIPGIRPRQKTLRTVQAAQRAPWGALKGLTASEDECLE